ncbi:hypothetical protein [Nonomuraea sp. NPDC049646]|uniref:hypothetical protein n=1 Tax=unclassified Nonomuraea TaxID=2593643 RepID=UPI003797800C
MERTLAWLTACRRLARDYERDPKISEAVIRWAACHLAGSRPPRQMSEARALVRRVLEVMTTVPALVSDHRFDLPASNP